MINPMITVVTVTYNAENFIEKTILSVINQTFKDIEYIIVDGNSTDGTLEIVKKYENKITKVISERDNGIYDAMNKGIKKASGVYLHFLNAGDEFYSSDTLEKVFSEYMNADVFYGRTALINIDGSLRKITTVPDKLSSKSFLTGMAVSHQSIIIRKTITELYDLDYKFVSDQDFIINALKKSKTIVKTNIILSKYQLGGFSDNNFFGCWRDKFKIVKKQFGYTALFLNYIVFLREYCKKTIKRVLGLY